MQGAIIGDLIASRFTDGGAIPPQFDLFTVDCAITDVSVLTVAVAQSVLDQTDLGTCVRALGEYLTEGGAAAATPPVSSLGWLHHEEGRVREQARRAAEALSYGGGEAKEAEALAAAILLGRQGGAKADLRQYLGTTFGYAPRSFVATAAGFTGGLAAFLQADDLIGAIRLAVTAGGNDPTDRAAVAGALSEAFFGPPDPALTSVTDAFIPEPLQNVLQRFSRAMQVG